MSAQWDIPYDINSYSPEAVGEMDSALDEACRQAAHLVHISEDIRHRLATSIFEGVRLGLRTSEDLVTFSLRSLPAVRAAEARAVR